MIRNVRIRGKGAVNPQPNTKGKARRNIGEFQKLLRETSK
jgi:hypothetical protein